jgi:sugar phosphate isomerase/epimerase
MMAADPDLLATCWSHAGNVGPMNEDQRSKFRLEDRIHAVAAAGFTGIGILHTDLAAARTRMGGYRNLRDVITASGITTIEVEWLDGWWTDGPARRASDRVRAELFLAADQLGADHIKVGGALDGSRPDWSVFVEEFAALCAEAAALGTRIAFEPMPMDNVRTLARARQLIDEAGEPAGGLMIDLWHMARGCTDNSAEIAALPARYIFAVELGDADSLDGQLSDDELIQDMWYRRRLCGQGGQDVTGFIQAIAAAGYAGPWGIEVIAEDFRQLPLLAQARESYSTTRTALGRAAAAPARQTEFASPRSPRP